MLLSIGSRPFPKYNRAILLIITTLLIFHRGVPVAVAQLGTSLSSAKSSRGENTRRLGGKSSKASKFRKSSKSSKFRKSSKSSKFSKSSRNKSSKSSPFLHAVVSSVLRSTNPSPTNQDMVDWFLDESNHSGIIARAFNQLQVRMLLLAAK